MAARTEPRGRQRMFWPARDVALVRFLVSTGARAEEACGVTIGEVDRRAERPIWRVGRSTGGKTRDVPLPRSTVDALDEWLAERLRPAKGRSAQVDRLRPAAWLPSAAVVVHNPNPVNVTPACALRTAPALEDGAGCQAVELAWVAVERAALGCAVGADLSGHEGDEEAGAALAARNAPLRLLGLLGGGPTRR